MQIYTYKELKPVEQKLKEICCKLIRISALTGLSDITVSDKLSTNVSISLYADYNYKNKSTSTAKDKSSITIRLVRNNGIGICLHLTTYDYFTINYGMLESKSTQTITHMSSNIRSIDWLDVRASYGNNNRCYAMDLPYFDFEPETILNLFEDLYQQFVGYIYDPIKEGLEGYMDVVPSLEELCGIKVSN